MASNQFPHPFGQLAKDYRALRRKLPAQASAIAESEFKENFKRQGYRSDTGSIIKWKARKNKGKGSIRAVLILSGRLRRSIRSRPTFDMARVVSDVPYAAAHNEGVSKTVIVKGHQRTATRRVRIRGSYTRMGKKTRSKNMAMRGTTHKVKSHRRKMNIPARPYMITTKPLLDDIERHIHKELDKIWKPT
jgi:phage gpG-like protein